MLSVISISVEEKVEPKKTEKVWTAGEVREVEGGNLIFFDDDDDDDDMKIMTVMTVRMTNDFSGGRREEFSREWRGRSEERSWRGRSDC